ncbi:MAG: DUF393 domain-containing protein [Phycisphaeraceae bacterium]|nr:DUF393 domain-containing protein [Phycisphaeraceae bacterium]
MEEPFAILIDGKCTLCRREARFMQNLDAGRGKLKILDITAPDFEPSRFGATEEALMGQIHGILSDGRMIAGMGVFRHAYRAVAEGGGIGARLMSAIVSVTGWPLIRPLADCFYRWFARHRIRISAIAARFLGEEPAMACEGDRCRVP